MHTESQIVSTLSVCCNYQIFQQCNKVIDRGEVIMTSVVCEWSKTSNIVIIILLHHCKFSLLKVVTLEWEYTFYSHVKLQKLRFFLWAISGFYAAKKETWHASLSLSLSNTVWRRIVVVLTAHKSLASTSAVWLRPISDQWAVIVASEDPLFHKATANLFPVRAPPHTCFMPLHTITWWIQLLHQFSLPFTSKSPYFFSFFPWMPSLSVSQINSQTKCFVTKVVTIVVAHLGSQQSPPYCLESPLSLCPSTGHHTRSTEEPILKHTVNRLNAMLNRINLKYYAHSHSHQISSLTLINAHMLKCDRYSSLLIPPFPTSNMSGSVNIMISNKQKD